MNDTEKAAVPVTGAEAPAGAGSTVGAVLVVGGGIGGIEAALELAESGYLVYLVEKSPQIGGVMPQLDKTFPTCDCSVCILSPKLVECGRHLNIRLLTYSELLDVQGGPGHFKVKIRKKARSVDVSKCTGCGTCIAGCPVQYRIQTDGKKRHHGSDGESSG